MSRSCVGVPKETAPGETLVALAPSHVPLLVKASIEVSIESGAGKAAGFDDDAYRSKGARIIATRDELFSAVQILLQVRTLGANPEQGHNDLALLRSDHTVIGLVDPLGNPLASLELATRGVTSTVVVVKRSLSPGFAGIPNPLFADRKTIMLFGDGREMVQAIMKVLKEE